MLIGRGRNRAKVLLFAFWQCLSFSGIASAQCGSNDRIYIDPKLVIQRPHYTHDQIVAVMNLPESSLSAEGKAKIYSQYREQDQPIQMPFSNGYVLISAVNPCIQQFIPLR
jgi:hypothetical protein